MELSTRLTQPISSSPPIRFLTPTPSLPSLLRRPPPLSRSTPRGLRSRVLYFNKPLPKATTSEEASSTGANRFFGEDIDGVTTFGEVPAVEKNVYNEKLPSEESKEESAADEGSLKFDFLEQFNIKLDSEDAYSVIAYGSGALVALWLTSAVVGAIDSIPLFPKMMEVVGLGYAFWFSSRYLLFKKNREELATKIEELKQQIFGSDNE
ncbi:protein CURVATURE THYLAKOID 1D, chloroplastic-like isoform X2 [Durio zibethinus]|uniref:Protein CURVATURE THYLAKOID 1D, chloroplastic-like isoform X2 n=1 Tax=Durio zibethinus TaxID=66656 RepID=A0A6P5YG70_DURZI|nr:protein CURVATURE THYLAKOID 1D, chloroplastic-like isoform X2 [Durio zibethinus]